MEISLALLPRTWRKSYFLFLFKPLAQSTIILEGYRLTRCISFVMFNPDTKVLLLVVMGLLPCLQKKYH